MRAQATQRGRIESEPSKREPTVGELASGAIRAAAGRSLRRVAAPKQGDGQ
jgi:hypothetical protein